MKLVTAAEMRELDRQAIEAVGIPSLVLMENAGRTTYQILRREFPDLDGKVAVLAGRGNNGGDGFVVARYLAQAGIQVAVFLLGRKDQVKGDAKVNLDILAHQGLEVEEVTEESHLNPLLHQLARADLIVDALLGTGLDKPVQGLLAALIDKLNHLRPPVLAVDMPTGLSADTGEILGVALQAEVTVTYGWPKIGQLMPPGRDVAGRLWQVDISIPPELAREVKQELPEARELRQLVPARPSGSHKGTFGHLLVLAGSEGKTGAAALASMGALRAGAGLVTLGIAQSLNDILEIKLTEAMTLPLPQAEGVRALGIKALEPILEFAKGCTALALGPGLGTHSETQELVRRLVRQLDRPMVVDADGVNAIAGDPSCLKGLTGPRILTPHPGEMARLIGSSPKEVQSRRLEVARETAAKHGAFIVLKGTQTVVAAPDGRLSLNPTGNPALASGGTGDVLTGLIGGLLSQRLSQWDAARLGVYLHGLTADQFAAQYGPRSMVAGDLLELFPEVLGRFTQGSIPRSEEEICYKRVIS
ncbi:MAG: NAD(P)H-hydrate dehydratase [Deltaproteobacteria bacterium]|nr:NAD(P)H-hydrate dehydratase [Deltaproteobacteria bacterium]